jgi:hypothetical protein
LQAQQSACPAIRPAEPFRLKSFVQGDLQRDWLQATIPVAS